MPRDDAEFLQFMRHLIINKQGVCIEQVMRLTDIATRGVEAKILLSCCKQQGEP